jgi:uncharacterized protein YjbI with pentapeptide repeats
MPNRGIRWTTGAIAVVLLGLAIVWALFVPAANWLAQHDVGSVTGSLRETALDNARGRLLTLGAGLFAAAALIFTARNFTLSREGQVTDRYTKAIEQLGSDKLDVRIGGIYALERIARDSARDHPTVMEVLTAFIREHSREWAAWLPEHPPPGDPEPQRPAPPDVQAALTVVGRRDAKRDIRVADLTGADLRGADLAGLNLRKANLTRVNLAGADLPRPDLRGPDLTDAVLREADLRDADLSDGDLRGTILHKANLRKANLRGANLSVLARSNLSGTTYTYVDLALADLRQADLRTASLRKATLIRADLREAHLELADLRDAQLTWASLAGADLRRADLRRAYLGGADLRGANLNGADMREVRLKEELVSVHPQDADLTGADLTDARWSADVPVPAGWKLNTDSGVLEREDAGSPSAEPN